MHELSIAQSLVELVRERLPPDAVRVRAVDLRIGVLAGVVSGALEFCYGIATEGTPLAGSELRIHELPLVIHCAVCDAERVIEGTPLPRCPECQTPSAHVRQGRELELAAIEYDGAEDSTP